MDSVLNSAAKTIADQIVACQEISSLAATWMRDIIMRRCGASLNSLIIRKVV